MKACRRCGYVHAGSCKAARTKANGWLRRCVWVREQDLDKLQDWLIGQGVSSLQELVALGIAGTPERAGRVAVRQALLELEDEQPERV